MAVELALLVLADVPVAHLSFDDRLVGVLASGQFPTLVLERWLLPVVLHARLLSIDGLLGVDGLLSIARGLSFSAEVCGLCVPHRRRASVPLVNVLHGLLLGVPHAVVHVVHGLRVDGRVLARFLHIPLMHVLSLIVHTRPILVDDVTVGEASVQSLLPMLHVVHILRIRGFLLVDDSWLVARHVIRGGRVRHCCLRRVGGGSMGRRRVVNCRQLVCEACHVRSVRCRLCVSSL